MKILKLILATSLISSCFFTMSLYAQGAFCGPHMVHCIYSTNTSNNGQGNFIRMIWPQRHLDKTFCWPYGDTFGINSQFINHWHVPKGKNDVVFLECANAQCTESVVLGIDSFTITALNIDHYVANPAYYPFKFKGIFPPVDCFSAANSALRPTQ